ncbi:MAG: hypothetical protein U0175_05785 [Caldilineaceae bacterium]
MKVLRIATVLILFVLSILVATGFVSAATETPNMPAVLDNVRSFAASPNADGISYANAGGKLIAGKEGNWHTVQFPADIIVAGIAIDTQRADVVYVGAANETSLYRTTDGGTSWLRVPLSTVYKGAVTTVAVDSTHRVVYAGTDQGALYRLLDVGSSIIMGGQQVLPEAIVELAVDPAGSNLAFARTATQLYQGDNWGLNWKSVNLHTTPTALAIANTSPATVYIGTLDNGVLKSNDGVLWLKANQGLNDNPGTRLRVDALAVDPADPTRLYVATSYLFGNTEVHESPVGVAMSEDAGAQWTIVRSLPTVAVSNLFPVSGKSEAVYAFFANSRTPFALGNAQQLVAIDTSAPASSWQQWLAGISLWQALIVVVASLAAVVVLLVMQRNRARQERVASK